MADKLIDSANKFRNLMDWEYEFVIGRKGIERAFNDDTIRFSRRLRIVQ